MSMVARPLTIRELSDELTAMEKEGIAPVCITDAVERINARTSLTTTEVDQWLQVRNQVRVSSEFAYMARAALFAHHRIPSSDVLLEVADERRAQDEEWGQQNHTAGTGPNLDIIDDIGYFPGEGEEFANGWLEDCAKQRTDALSNVPGRVTWAHILTEEWAEVMACDDYVRLREELIQLAAVAVAFVESEDRRVARDHQNLLDTP